MGTRLSFGLSEDADLSYRDIGTDDDLGSVDPMDDGDYDGQAYDTYDSFEGIAHALVSGPLRLRALESGNLRQFISDLIHDMLQRAIADKGSTYEAISSLCFNPGMDDLFDGARIEVRGKFLIAYNGHEGQQKVMRPRSSEELIRDFLAAGIFVLSGMIKSLADI